MKSLSPQVMLFALLFVAFSCNKEPLVLSDYSTDTFSLEVDQSSDLAIHERGTLRSPGVPLCGPALRAPYDPAGTAVPGGMRVANSVDRLFIELVSKSNWRITATRLYVGPCAGIPLDMNGDPDVDAFPLQTNSPNGVPVVRYYDLLLANLPDCYCIVAYVEFEDFNNGMTLSKFVFGDTPVGNGYSVDYCTIPCGPECELGHRTQTPGGWGANPNGNNAGTYLHDNFAAAYPGGLVVGCNFTITLTTAQAVTDLLPTGGPAAPLTQDYVDPNSVGTVLAGHVIALALNVGFDAYDPNFGASDFPLADLVIGSGTFAGWTVGDILNEAQQVLGGCGSAYTAAQLNDAATAINQNFVDGTIDLGYLVCP